jgi:ABC-type lipoprotein release transport system permease subunit
MKNILKKSTFVTLFIYLILTVFHSCQFMDKNKDEETTTIKKDTIIDNLTANAEAEEYEKIENSHTLTAIFDENGNVIAQEATTNENGELKKNKSSAPSLNSNIDHLNNKKVKNIENDTLENKLGTISANEKSINEAKQKNQNDFKQNSKKLVLPSNVEIDAEQEKRSQKANNAIPNF